MMVDISRVPVAKYGAESSKLNTDIAKQPASFERKGLRRIFGGIIIN